MPKLSDTMEEGVVVCWLKRIGDVVAKGDVVAEIETDKATMEMESSEEGVLAEIYVEEGERVSVGHRIALIRSKSELEGIGEAEWLDALTKNRISQDPLRIPHTEPDEVRQTQETARREDGQVEGTAGEGALQKNRTIGAGSPGRIKASPRARKAAEEMKVDLSLLQGSGPGGRVVYRDVLSASSGGQVESKTPPVSRTAAAENEWVPLTNMRRLIAQRMVESKTRVPHFYLQVEIDAEPLLQLQGQINSVLIESNGGKLSINDIVLKAAALALARVPQVNASFTPEGILRHGQVHLGFAVSLEEGLITPVIRNAESKDLRQISREAADLIDRARNKRLKPDEYQGGTFTVSNLGAMGIDSFQAIIDPPQGAILGVGSIVKKPVVAEDDQIRVGHRLNLTLSCDHRVVDGAVGAEFLRQLRRFLEQPALMLL